MSISGRMLGSPGASPFRMAEVWNPLIDDDEAHDDDEDDDGEAEGRRVEILAKVGKRDRVVVELTVEVVVRRVRASIFVEDRLEVW